MVVALPLGHVQVHGPFTAIVQHTLDTALLESGISDEIQTQSVPEAFDQS